jgi:mannosyl-oligosaccharide alpha-1,2-mannosidase
MYSRDPFNLRKAPPSALTFLQSSAQNLQSTATKAIESSSAAVRSTTESLKTATEDMSFAIPRNVPNFENAQRRFEDGVWNKFTGNDKGLPMYKDKPAGYGSQKRGAGGMFRRKRGIAFLGLVTFGLLYWLGWFGGGSGSPSDGGKSGSGSGTSWGNLASGSKKGGKADWEQRRQNVKDAFLLSWKAYEEHGWGILHHIFSLHWFKF